MNMRRTAASAKREVILPFCVRPSARAHDGVGNGRADGAFHPRRHGGHPHNECRRLHRRQAQEISGKDMNMRRTAAFAKREGDLPFFSLSCLGTGQKHDIFSEICPVPKHDKFAPSPNGNKLSKFAPSPNGKGRIMTFFSMQKEGGGRR